MKCFCSKSYLLRLPSCLLALDVRFSYIGVCGVDGSLVREVYVCGSACGVSIYSSFFTLLPTPDGNKFLIVLWYLYMIRPTTMTSSKKKIVRPEARPADEPLVGHTSVLFPETQVLLTSMICKKGTYNNRVTAWFSPK